MDIGTMPAVFDVASRLLITCTQTYLEASLAIILREALRIYALER